MLKVIRRPKWLLMLGVVLIVMVIFVELGKWQLDSAIRSAQSATAPAAPPTTLGEAATPQQGLLDASIGRTVSFEGVVDPRDIDIVAERLQGETEGYWVIGHVYVTHDGITDYDRSPRSEHAPGLAVAFGWAPTPSIAEQAAADLRASLPPAGDAEPTSFAGRLEYGQTPTLPERDADPHALTEMAPAFLVNRWAEAGPSNYGSYVILDLDDAQRAGLDAIEVRSADVGSGLNMLNVFYAIEWLVFAVFALFVWWRMVRSEYDHEQAAMLEHKNPDARAAEEVRLAALRRLRDERASGGREAGPGEP